MIRISFLKPRSSRSLEISQRPRGIDTNPSNAQLQNCKANNRSEFGQCQFQGENMFGNTFFNTGAPFDAQGLDKLEDFAFFVDSPEELIQALKKVSEDIRAISTSGVSPTAPQSSTAVALRDRIFLSILTPITPERFWQGRLALFGFVDVPGNQGSKEVIRRPRLVPIWKANRSLGDLPYSTTTAL
ncbi:MAG: hypothetical protein R3B51_07860 [Thermodesulfobacteriota bacterium]